MNNDLEFTNAASHPPADAAATEESEHLPLMQCQWLLRRELGIYFADANERLPSRLHKALATLNEIHADLTATLRDLAQRN